MAILFRTTNASGLLTAFKKAIDEGRVVTWAYDQDGDFTHTAEQWRNAAWLRPKSIPEGLAVNILCPKNRAISTEVYAIYHGRFIESLLAHYDSLFVDASATAKATQDDIISPRQ
jgi:hypothetical protein